MGVHARESRASSDARRAASVAASTSSVIVLAGTSIAIASPSLTKPIGPPSAASGETWPIESPDEPPENLPSVTRGSTAGVARRIGGAELLHPSSALAQHDAEVAVRKVVGECGELAVALRERCVVERELRVEVRVQRGRSHSDGFREVAKREALQPVAAGEFSGCLQDPVERRPASDGPRVGSG